MSAVDLQPGDRLRHVKSGTVVWLARRKMPSDDRGGLPYHSGWWLKDDAGGLADFVIDGGEWELMADSGSASSASEGARTTNNPRPPDHAEVKTPNWDTKTRCTCGFESVSRCEWALHVVRELGLTA